LKTRVGLAKLIQTSFLSKHNPLLFQIFDEMFEVEAILQRVLHISYHVLVENDSKLKNKLMKTIVFVKRNKLNVQ